MRYLLGFALLLLISQSGCVPSGETSLSYQSGGYCDAWGCPEDYWDYPVFYGPVYYGDAWYDGPFYYRAIDGDDWYWVHGGWHRDEWQGPHPHWWHQYRYGPALGYSYYTHHDVRREQRYRSPASGGQGGDNHAGWHEHGHQDRSDHGGYAWHRPSGAPEPHQQSGRADSDHGVGPASHPDGGSGSRVGHHGEREGWPAHGTHDGDRADHGHREPD